MAFVSIPIRINVRDNIVSNTGVIQKELVKNDTMAYQLEIMILGLANLSEISLVEVFFKTAGGIEVVDSATKVYDGFYTYVIASNALVDPGALHMVVRTYKGTTRITSKEFEFNVLGELGDASEAVSGSTNLPILTNLINEVDNLLNTYETAETNRNVLYENAESIRTDQFKNKLDQQGFIFKNPVSTYSDMLTAYPNPSYKWTVRTTSDGKLYRYNGDIWELIDIISASAYDSLVSQFNLQKSRLNKELNAGIYQKKTRKPIVSFVDDDGDHRVYSLLKPLVDELNIKLTSCLITNKVGTLGYITEPQLFEMQDSGLFEFCSHTHNHVYLAQITPEEAEEEMINSKKWLLDRNLCDDVIVYPYGDVNTQVRNIAKKYFRAGIMNDVGNHKINTPPFKSYNIERVYVDFGVDLAKQKIDEAIANNSWVIFGMHCHYETWSADDIRAIVSYIREKGVEIVSVTEGLNLMGNIVEIGDSYYPNTPGTFIVDCEGKSYGTDAPQTIYREIGNITASSTPAAFQIGKTTIITIPNDNVDRGFPTYAYGTLITNVYGTSLDFAYTNQELKIHDTNYKYVRYWKKTEAAWSNFRRINDSYFYSNNVISASTPLSQFDVGISFAYMNDAGGSGLPDNKGGIIMTFNSGAGGWSYQLHKQYNTSNLYIRTSNTDGSWGSFINLTPVNTHKIASTNAYDFNTPITNFPANQITTNIINSQSSTGFPNNSPGTLTTYRISDAWGRQEYRVYQSNAIYGRYVNSSNAWSDFEKISAV